MELREDFWRPAAVAGSRDLAPLARAVSDFVAMVTPGHSLESRRPEARINADRRSSVTSKIGNCFI